MINYIAKIMDELLFKKEVLSFDFNGQSIPIILFTKDKKAFLTIGIGEDNASVITEFTDVFQGALFEWALSEFSNFSDEMTKNAYLILLVEDILAKDYEKKVFINIEEDAFFFKKYILSFSQGELNLLKVKTSDENIVDSLGSLAVDQSIFERFSQKDKEMEGYERLLYQLFIKVPVISLPTKAQEIESLEKAISQNIEELNVDQVHKVILENLDDIPDSKIDLKMFKQIVGKL